MLLRHLGAAALALALTAGLGSVAQARAHHHDRGDARPRAWCGWFMRHVEHVADRRFNLARHWASYGVPAHGPAIGVVVVWPHHVGKIVDASRAGWIVLSGNDGHRVRARLRPLTGAIAFRRPAQRFARRAG